MPSWKRCPKSVDELANAVLFEYPEHKPLIDNHVTFDFLFAFPDYDEHGEPINDALVLHGVPASAIARITKLKDRVKGMADAEVAIDGERWEKMNEAERRAVLDHELFHFEIKPDKEGNVKDDIGRPRLKMREHDRQFGWFDIIAKRHGQASVECQQAKELMDEAGQFYFQLEKS